MTAVRVAGCVNVAGVQDLGDVLLEHGVSQKDINMACDLDELVELAASRGAIKQVTKQVTGLWVLRLDCCPVSDCLCVSHL